MMVNTEPIISSSGVQFFPHVHHSILIYVELHMPFNTQLLTVFLQFFTHIPGLYYPE